jgi:ABC-2 type transport system permease protein
LKAILLRELSAYFSSPVGFVWLAVFWILSGYQFAIMILSGSSNMTEEFTFLYTVTILLIPILTMRLFSEEWRQRTASLLFSAPIHVWEIVAGKYFAAVTIFALGVSMIPFQAAVLTKFGQVSWPMIIGNLLGLMLLGCAGIAVCMFVSAQTENQIIAAVCGFAVMILVLSIGSLARSLPTGSLRTLMSHLSFYHRYYDLTVGIFDVSNLLFFVSFSYIFCSLTSFVLNSRRWSAH